MKKRGAYWFLVAAAVLIFVAPVMAQDFLPYENGCPAGYGSETKNVCTYTERGSGCPSCPGSLFNFTCEGDNVACNATGVQICPDHNDTDVLGGGLQPAKTNICVKGGGAQNTTNQDPPTEDSFVIEVDELLLPELKGSSTISRLNPSNLCDGDLNGPPHKGTYLAFGQSSKAKDAVGGSFTINKAGTYYLWNRWFTEVPSEEYVIVITDPNGGVHRVAASEDATLGTLCGGWKRFLIQPLPQGLHGYRFECIDHGDPSGAGWGCVGGASDQILVTDDPSFTPVGSYGPPAAALEPQQKKSDCEQLLGEWSGEYQPSCCLPETIGEVGIDDQDRQFICLEDRGDFKWAPSGQLHFKIIEIEGQDKVSNKEEFFTCDESRVNKGIPPPTFGTFEDIARSSKFMCVNRGGNYEFIECCDPDAFGNDTRVCDNPGSRSRPPGEHFASFESFILPQEFSLGFAGQTQDYPVDITHWGGYQYLVFFLKASADLDIDLAFTDDQGDLIWSDAIINYAVTAPRPGKWVKFMIPTVPKVPYQQLSFISTNKKPGFEGNDVNVRNMYLHSSPSGDFFCSGATYRGGFVPQLWINDLDANERDFNNIPVGQRACEQNDALTWTGSMCCGDDNTPTSRESYTDPTGAVCWNGDALPEDTPAMEVAYNVDYNVKDWFLEEQTFNYKLNWQTREEDFQTRSGGGSGSTRCRKAALRGCGPGRLLVNYVLSCPAGYDLIDSRITSWGGDNVAAPFSSVNPREPGKNASVTFSCVAGPLRARDRARCSVQSEISCYKTWPQSHEWNSPSPTIQPRPGKIELGTLSQFINPPYLWDDPYRGNPDTVISPGTHGDVIPLTLSNVSNENVNVYFNGSDPKSTTDFDVAIVAEMTRFLTKPKVRQISDSFSYLCSEGNCEFITHQPSLSLTNILPNLYDLTFIGRSGATKSFSSSTSFSEPGTIRATSLPRQIIATQGTVGLCTPSSHLLGKVSGQDTALCGVLGSYFCGPLGWSNEASGGLEATERVVSKTAFSGRNLLNNPSFQTFGELPQFWNLPTPSSYTNDTSKIKFIPTLDGKTNSLGIVDDLAVRHVGLVSKPVRVTPNTQYTLSGDLFCKSSSESIALVAELLKEDVLVESVKIESAANPFWTRSFSSFDTKEANFVRVLITSDSPNAECFADDLMLQEGADDTPIYHAPSSSGFGQSCCAADYCWDGAECTPDVSSDPLAPPVHENRCIKGQWSLSPRVDTFDGKTEGFCPSASECLVDLTGDIDKGPLDWYSGDKPLCIGDNTYFEDNLCEDGEWTSRTRALALAMLQLINESAEQDDYTLYCDKFDNVLVDVQYQNIEESILGPVVGPLAKSCFDDVSAPCVNNFCVLSFTDRIDGKERRVVGTTLNRDIDDAGRGFLFALEKPTTYCDDAKNQPGFSKCSGDDQLWYASEFNALIASQDSIRFDGPTGGEEFLYVLKNPISSLVKWISGPAAGPLQKDLSFTQRASRFNRIFIDVDGEKRIDGVVEEVGEEEFAAISYQNTGLDICSYVNAAARTQGIGVGVQQSDITCEKVDSTYNVFTQDRIDLWQQFILPGRGTLAEPENPLG